MKVIEIMKKRILFISICLILLFNTQAVRTEAKVSNANARNFANIVIFAYFQDDETGEEFFKTNSEKIMEIYDGSQGRSFTNYMKTISYGKFQVKNIFPQYKDGKIEAYQLSMTMSEARSKNVDAQIIQELMPKVSEITDQTVDYDNDGILDNVTIILRGNTESSVSGVPSLYSHKSDYPGSLTWSGKQMVNYNMLSTYSLLESTLSSESGLISHEFLHSLGYPDLYTNNGSYPVYTWDIMAANSRYVQYPLAYTRMYFTNWIDIDTITQSTENLTLDLQSNEDGNQAYILQSPLNSQEVFVVEFRKKKEYGTGELAAYDYDSLDAKTGGSGIIVYRVDKTVEGLSNRNSEDRPGIYVFRPQSGQSGYSESAAICVQSAYLSEESGRTSIGSADLSKGLTDGALTFSDGSNSGIVISNVSSSSGDQMTLDVSIPDASQYDLWNDTGFADESNSSLANKSITIENINGVPYAAAFSDGVIQLYKYENEKWIRTGASISDSSVSEMNLFTHQNQIYLSYMKDGQTLYVKKYDNGTWTTTAKKDNINSSYDVESINGELYFAYTVNNTSGTNFSISAVLAKENNGALEDIGTFFGKENNMCGQPKICECNGQIYVSVRNANGNVIEVYRRAGSNFQKISDDEYTGGSYDMVSLNGKIYVLLGGTSTKMAVYDGNSWKAGNEASITSSETNLIAAQGNLYVLADGNTGTENTKVYRYDEKTDSFEQEGGNVDGAAQGMSFVANGNTLFVSYLRNLDGKMVIKSKTTVATDGGQGNSDDNKENQNTEGNKNDSGQNQTTEGNKNDSDQNQNTGENKNNAGQSDEKVNTKSNTVSASSTKTLPKTKITSLKKGKKKITVKWKKKKQITGYQIQYSTDKKFKKNRKTVTVKAKKTSRTITKLKSKKKYYVRIRTYKTVKSNGKTKKSYSGWSAVKSVKTK
jgi:hypothetical protein